MSVKFSAEDIANQSFERRFRGYDAEQVEEFLSVVAREWTHMVTELERLRESLENKEEALDEYRNREQRLHDTLDMAKQASDEIRQKAEREAELTVADAELEAERILSDAEDRIAEVRNELYDLKQQRARFENELESLVKGHLRLLDVHHDEAEDAEQSAISRRPSAPPEDVPNASSDEALEEKAEASEETEDEEGDTDGDEDAIPIRTKDIESSDDAVAG